MGAYLDIRKLTWGLNRGGWGDSCEGPGWGTKFSVKSWGCPEGMSNRKIEGHVKANPFKPPCGLFEGGG